MLVLAAANPAGSDLTFIFPVVLFACVTIWAIFQYSRR
jgi:hypothetical protein